MEWSHTHFDGYELLATPSDSPPSLVLLDSSALVLVQRVLLPKGDSPPRSLTWQPGGARTGCSSGALSCVVSVEGGSPELAVFTPHGVHLSSRVRYSWSCAARVPLSPLHKGVNGKILLAWSCRGPLVVADQALSVWSNSRTIPEDATDSLSTDEDPSSDDHAGASDQSEEDEQARTPKVPRHRSAYRNVVRLSRKWVRKAGAAGPQHTPLPYVALATSPCGCLFAAACGTEVVLWLRRRNLSSQERYWDRGARAGARAMIQNTSSGSTGGLRGGHWDYQPASVLAHDSHLTQVAWGRGPGNQQDYLLTLEESGKARVWVEQSLQDRETNASQRGTVKFLQAATIKSWYGHNLSLSSVGFVKWAYFGSHGKDLIMDDGKAPGSAYHLVYRQEMESEGGAKPVRSDNCVIGCGQDGRLFLWSLQDMPLPDGRTTPGLVEVSTLRLGCLAGSPKSAGTGGEPGTLPRVSAVGYYDALGSGGAPTELQAVARARGGLLAVITARVHHDPGTSKFGFRNTRCVVLPLAERGLHSKGTDVGESESLITFESTEAPRADQGAARGKRSAKREVLSGLPHPNLPLVASLRRVEDGEAGEEWCIEVHSWVNGGSHLQCIPCKPQGAEGGQVGYTAGADPPETNGRASRNGRRPGGKDTHASGDLSVAPLFNELAQKFRSGNELCFVPFALPSLVLDDDEDDARAEDGKGSGEGSEEATGWGGQITHALWLADWIGAEALPPALVVIDAQSRLHVFELDDGAAAEGEDGPEDAFDAHASLSMRTASLSKSDGSLNPRASWSHPRFMSSRKSGKHLSHSAHHLSLKGLREDSGRGRRRSPERPSRRARQEVSGRLVLDEPLSPREKTVVLPLDGKYGLGLTLAFHENRVAVASFVRHPDTEAMLPAEASGRIQPGDHLVDINGTNIEGLGGDDATALIRKARRQSMEGGAVTLELTFREGAHDGASAKSKSGLGSPKPSTGWYRSRRGSFGTSSRSRPSLEPAETGGVSTDADQHALCWRRAGRATVPAFETCALLPWMSEGDDVSSGRSSEAVGGPGGEMNGGLGEVSWTELGVYPSGDPRRCRPGLLMGFHAAGGDDEGYVVALLLEIDANGGVSVSELCRAPLGAMREPVTLNREKLSPGAPVGGYVAVDAVCADGWVRRWRVVCGGDAGAGGIRSAGSVAEPLASSSSSYTIRTVDVCQPFGGITPSGLGEVDPGKPDAIPELLLAVASSSLLAIGRRDRSQSHVSGAPVVEGRDAPEVEPLVEVWSCPDESFPEGKFVVDEPIALPELGEGERLEAMCWVSPEVGDERGAAVGGYCLCLSMGEAVVMFARERKELPPAGERLLTANSFAARQRNSPGRTWSAVLRVANPCLLLGCRSAGLRDFCQGLMAKYQRNLALAVVRSRPRGANQSWTTAIAATDKELAARELESKEGSLAKTNVRPPLSRLEINNLRGGSVREGRHLEDWHPEGLVAMWCTSLLAQDGDADVGPPVASVAGGSRAKLTSAAVAWAKGRERTLSVLKWVSAEVKRLGDGAVVSGTVVPVLSHGLPGGSEVEKEENALWELSTNLMAYLEKSATVEAAGDAERTGKVPASGGRDQYVQRQDPAEQVKEAVELAALAEKLPGRLRIMPSAELCALSAILDEALGMGHDASGASSRAYSSNKSSSSNAQDTAAALFASLGQPPQASGAADESGDPGESTNAAPERPPLADVVAPRTDEGDECANVFLLARGLRTRLVRCSKLRGENRDKFCGEGGALASSAALAMLLALDATQEAVIERLCPKSVSLGAAAAGVAGDNRKETELTWDEASRLMLPLWLRDVKELQRVTSTLAGNTYRCDRDLMAAALFYVVLGDNKKLLALAKADSGFLNQRALSGAEGSLDGKTGRARGASVGQRLEKLLAHDFSSTRGRGVAEKNAYILLRKRDFKAAATVFLLARPAMLKEALQIILLHVKDLQLALLVARLIEVRDAGDAQSNFGGRGLGGGGAKSDAAEKAFALLKGASRRVLREEILPAIDGECGAAPETYNRRASEPRRRPMGSLSASTRPRDAFLECACLFWLGQSERALHALCRGEVGSSTPEPVSGLASPGNDGKSKLIGSCGEDSALIICNRAIDVATRPLLIAKLKEARQRKVGGFGGFGGMANSRSGARMSPGVQRASDSQGDKQVLAPKNAYRAAAARLMTVDYLSRNGMELCALEVLGRDSGRGWAARLDEEIEEEDRQQQADTPQPGSRGALGGFSGGSLGGFGGYSSPSPPGTSVAASGELSDDMFGGLGEQSRARASPPASALASGELSGDLFGGFDGPAGRAKPKPSPPAKALASGELSGDMFGSFDGPGHGQSRSKPKPSPPANALASGELSGDLFGGFDGPAGRAKPKPSPPAKALASGELSGDMFGSFDGPGHGQSKSKPKASPPAGALNSGELSGGMFGDFGGPPRARAQPPPPSPADAVASGEIGGDMFGAFGGPTQQRQPKLPSPPAAGALASGELTGDMIGGFDMPARGNARGSPEAQSKRVDVVSSGELSGSSFDSFGGRDGRSSFLPRTGSTVSSATDGQPDGQHASPKSSSFWSNASSSRVEAVGSSPPAVSGTGHGGKTSGSKAYGYADGEELDWNTYDEFVREVIGESTGGEKGKVKGSSAVDERQRSSSDPEESRMWALRAEDLAYGAATRRLLRELRYLLGGLDVVAPTAPNMALALESLGATTGDKAEPSTSEKGSALLEDIRSTTKVLCEIHGLSTRALTAAAAGAMCHTSAGGSRRLSAICLLLEALGRPVAADAAVCAAAGRLVQCCSVHGRAPQEDLSLRVAQARASDAEVDDLAEEDSKSAAEPAPGKRSGASSPAATKPTWYHQASGLTSGSTALQPVSVLAGDGKDKGVESRAGGRDPGADDLRPHLSELRSAAFQLELCLNLHARGCLRLSSRAQAEAVVGFRAGLLMEALGQRYDVTTELVRCRPAPLQLDDLALAGCEFEASGLGGASLGSVSKLFKPSSSRLLKKYHSLGDIVATESPRGATNDAAAGAAAGQTVAGVAKHPAFCPGLGLEDAESCLKGHDTGTFLLRPLAVEGSGGVEEGRGGLEDGGDDRPAQEEKGAVVLSVVTGRRKELRHLVLRAELDVPAGVSCGLIGPEATMNELLCRIRHFVSGGESPQRVEGRREERAPPGGSSRELGTMSGTPNTSLLESLSRLPKPKCEAMGLEPWEAGVSGRSTSSRPSQDDVQPMIGPSVAPSEEVAPPRRRRQETAESQAASRASSLATTRDEKLSLVRLTDSLSRGVWPTYARIACAIDLLSLRAIHSRLCDLMSTLLKRRCFRARAPLAARVCCGVPFLPLGEEMKALGGALAGSIGEGERDKGVGRGGMLRDFRISEASAGGAEPMVVSGGTPSSAFYSAGLHPLYVWAQCLDRQFYAQAHRPTVSPSHHLIPRRQGRLISTNTLLARASGGDVPSLSRLGRMGSAVAGADAGEAERICSIQWAMTSPTDPQRECCSYLFQRGMVVSEEGVRGGQDHLRDEERWPEEDKEERIAYQALNGIRNPDGTAVPSVPLHVVREGSFPSATFVEGFYSSDARSWLVRSGNEPAGPSAGARLRRWEAMGIVQRIEQAHLAGGPIHFRGERHKGDVLLRFVDRWEAEQCGDASGGALRAGPLGRMSYLPVPAGRSDVGADTLYGRLLLAIGGKSAAELWIKLGAEDWLVKTISRAEFPFSYRHQLADFTARLGWTLASRSAPLTPAAAAAAASEMPCPLHDGRRQEQHSFCLCVFEHLCRNALFRRLRLPHRFQALVSVQLLGLKNLSPHYHPSKTDVFAAVALKRPDPAMGGGGGTRSVGNPSGGDLSVADPKRRGKETFITPVKRLLPTANGQANQQSRWGVKAGFRFALPEEASPYVLAYGDRAYELVMGGYGPEGTDGGIRAKGTGAGIGVESQGPPRCVRITVWRKLFVTEQRLGEVEVPLNGLDDRGVVNEWVALRGDKGSAWFVNVRFSLRFVMVSVPDPNPVEDNSVVDDGSASDSPVMTLSHALADVDIM